MEKAQAVGLSCLPFLPLIISTNIPGLSPSVKQTIKIDEDLTIFHKFWVFSQLSSRSSEQWRSTKQVSLVPFVSFREVVGCKLDRTNSLLFI